MGYLLSACISCPCVVVAAVDGDAITAPGDEWLNYGRDYSEQRFSPLQQVNTDNVERLGLAWSFSFPSQRVMEATPLVHEGVLYTSSAWSRVYALDATNGNLLWEYDPDVPKSHLINSCCGPANRGLALWSVEGKARVFVGSFDGRLIALDAGSGKVIWSVRTVPEDSHYTITGAPRVVNGKVIIGNGGAELGVRGYVSAYDAVSGEMLWRFYTVPGDPAEPQESEALERALPSWNGQWWQVGGGGGTVWDAMAYDPELDLLYIGTGNGSPWNREIRSPGGGDNLYLSSIVALRPDTGEYVWHYQVTPKDSWDYTATQHLILADIEIEGALRQVIMQAPKNGFFYVLDRVSGEFISAEAYAQINWASHVDKLTGRPVENAVADYNKTGGSLIWPAPFGAHNWQPMSYSHNTGLVYIPTQHVAAFYAPDKNFSFTKHRWNTGTDTWEMRYDSDPIISRASADALLRGYLVAWDPVSQQKVWQVRHNKVSNGGILSTAGELVFQGTGEGGFHAYGAKTGERLWSFQSDSAILAAPMTYRVNGEQYVAVNQGAGGTAILALGEPEQTSQGNPNRLLVFKLQSVVGEQASPLVPPPPELPQLESARQEAEEVIVEGEKIYERNCAVCHGISAEGSGVVPDLRYMDETTHSEFQAIVLAGLKTHKGMVGFYQTLSPQQVDAVHAYVISRNQALQDINEWSYWDHGRYWFWYFLTWLGDKYPWLANVIL